MTEGYSSQPGGPKGPADSAVGHTLLMFHGLLAPIAYDHNLAHGLARPCPGHVQWGGTGNPGELWR